MKLVEERAVIVALEADGAAWVEPLQESGCGGCAASGQCGTALLGRALPRRRHRLRLENPLALPEGTVVIIGLPTHALLYGAILVYLVPLFGFLAGGLLGARLLPGGDLGALAGAVAGMAAALGWGQRRVRRYGRALTPRLLRPDARLA